MKVALVHDWLADWAGAERVFAEIVSCFPDADIFSLVDSLSDEDRQKILGKRATTSFINRLPFSSRRPWKYLPLMPLAIEQFNLSGYDLIISSSHAVAKGVITGPDQIHLSYVHSPMRYAWDLQDEYLRGHLGKGLQGIALRLLLHYLRIWDVRTSHGADAIAANSAFVARRVQKAYGRKARVIHPPVDLSRFSVKESKENFYLCASRLMPYKRIPLIAESFSRTPQRKLVVIGEGPDMKSLKRIAGPNVDLMGYQPDEVLATHLQNARALIFAAEEDFGILPVEAQACGTPVIAYGKGGVRETVRDISQSSPTGVFFPTQSPEAVIDAVDRFERYGSKISPADCRSNSERFSVTRFRTEFLDFAREATSASHHISSNLPGNP